MEGGQADDLFRLCLGINTGNPGVTLGYFRATRTPTPAYPYPHSGVRVFTDMGCGLVNEDDDKDDGLIYHVIDSNLNKYTTTFHL